MTSPYGAPGINNKKSNILDRKPLHEILKSLRQNQELSESILLEYTSDEIDEAYYRLGRDNNNNNDDDDDDHDEDDNNEENTLDSQKIEVDIGKKLQPKNGLNDTLQIIDLEMASNLPNPESSSLDGQFPVDILKYMPSTIKLTTNDWMLRLKQTNWKFGFLTQWDPNWPHAETKPSFILRLESYISAIENAKNPVSLPLESWKDKISERTMRYHSDMHDTDQFVTIVFILRRDYFVYIILQKPASSAVGYEALSSVRREQLEDCYRYYFHYYTWSETKIDHFISLKKIKTF